MKLPVSFGSRLFYRVVLPGSIVAAPAMMQYGQNLEFNGSALQGPVVFVAAVLLIGWIFLLLDRPIYMILEGRRYWPASVWRLGVSLERRRLLRLLQTMRRHDKNRASVQCQRKNASEFDRIYYESSAKLSEFPLDPVTLMPAAIWPTRLGNLMAAYEQYPQLKYGLDGVFSGRACGLQ